VVEIACPADCPYLRQHETFQKEKLKARYRKAWMQVNADIKDNSDMIWAVLAVERALKQATEKLEGLTDAEAAAGLTDVDRRLSPIELVDQPSTPCGDLMWALISALMEERYIPRDRMRDAVRRETRVCTALSDPHTPRAFLHGLLGWMDEFSSEKEERPSGFIITPDDLR